MKTLISIRLFIILLIGLFGSYLWAATSIEKCIVENTESVYVHTNKKCYVSGEKIYYKSYIKPSVNITQTSNILYFELRSLNNSMIFPWRTSIMEGNTSGSVTLPDTLKTGFYQLYAYTNILRNYNSESLFKTLLFVSRINEFTPQKIEIPEDSPTPAKQNLSRTIRSNLTQSRYRKGEEMIVSIENTSLKKDLPGNVSVSINEKSPFDEKLQTCYETSPEESNLLQEKDHNGYFIKETASFSIKGSIHNKTTKQPLKNTLLFASCLGNASNLNYAFTDEKGNFRFLFDKQYDNQIIYFQLYKSDINMDKVAWKFVNTLPESSVIPVTKKILDKEAQDYIERLKSAELVHRVYANAENERVDSVVNQSANFYHRADYVVKPSEYTDFPNFDEIASNILPGIRFSKSSKGYKLSVVVSESQKVYEQGVMVFLNGIPIDNYAYLYTLGSKDIERIEVCNKEFLYGDLTIYGVVSISTYTKEFDLASFANPFYLYDNTVKGNAEIMKVAQNSMAQQVNSHVTWNDNLTILPGEREVLKLKTPNIAGDFILCIRGLDSDGELVSINQEFKVE